MAKSTQRDQHRRFVNLSAFVHSNGQLLSNCILTPCQPHRITVFYLWEHCSIAHKKQCKCDRCETSVAKEGGFDLTELYTFITGTVSDPDPPQHQTLANSQVVYFRQFLFVPVQTDLYGVLNTFDWLRWQSATGPRLAYTSTVQFAACNTSENFSFNFTGDILLILVLTLRYVLLTILRHGFNGVCEMFAW